MKKMSQRQGIWLLKRPLVSALIKQNAPGRILIIALTSYAMAGDRERLMQAGFNGYIEKPLDPLYRLSDNKGDREDMPGTDKILIKEELEKVNKKLQLEIEERARVEKELKDANIRLNEVDRLKSVFLFLSGMSHKLKTPLNSIIGFTGIMLMGMTWEITEEQRNHLFIVKDSANHLLSLINDILDISKIETGKVELSPGEFGLNEVISEVVETISPAINEKGLKLIREVPEGITLFSDKRRIKQVMINLTNNAVKFTDRGIKANKLREPLNHVNSAVKKAI